MGVVLQSHIPWFGSAVLKLVLLGAGLGGGCVEDNPDWQSDGGSSAPKADDGGAGIAELPVVLGPLTTIASGLPDGTGYSARYVDKGVLAPTTPIRMLIGYPLRAEAQLDQVL